MEKLSEIEEKYFLEDKMIKDYFLFSIRSIKKRRLRSWLTILGIFVGISVVISLISLGQGMQTAISELLKNIGADRLIITPGGGVTTGVTPLTSELAASKLYERDVDEVKKVKGVEHAVGAIVKTTKVQFEDEIKYAMVFGIPTDTKTKKMIEEIDFFMIEEGRHLRDGDVYKADIGYSVAKDVFDDEIKIGGNVFIKGKAFTVVGLQKKSGSPVHDRMLRIPVDTAKELFETNEISTIFAKVEEGLVPSEVADDVQEALRKERGLEEGKEDFTVSSAEQIISSMFSILSAVQIVLIGIAAVSLLVGGIGIMNTMYTSVLERTKDIGVMKAVGAKNSDVMLLFLFESGLLGLIGGTIGIAIGIGLSKAVEFGAAALGASILKASVTAELVVFALLFSFTIGCVSGLLPARKASKMNPIEALRYE